MDVYVLALKDDPEIQHSIGLRYLLAVLNSSLMDYAYITYYGRRKKSEFEYYTKLIENIPIRKPPEDLRKKLEKYAEYELEKNNIRITLIKLFVKNLEAIPGKSREFLKHYYNNPSDYSIIDRERLYLEQKTQVRKQKSIYTINKIAIEEVDDYLIFEANFQYGDGPFIRKPILKLTINDKDIREFILYSVKQFIDNSRRKKIIGKDKDILNALLKSVKITRFKTNKIENVKEIKKLIDEFKSKAPIDLSFSEIERQIWFKSQEIDELVYSLYKLDSQSKNMLRELYHCNNVSEYFERLKEYSGIEDINA